MLKLFTLFTSFIAIISVSAEPADEYLDFINFKNDDILHGKFLGFTTSGKIIWKNKAAEKNIAFTKDEVRKVVINQGKLNKPFTHTSHVTLTNKDVVPGKILSFNENSVQLITDYAGELELPRNLIENIDFRPLGDNINYRGPFTPDDWKHFPYSTTTSTDTTKEDEPAWTFSSFAWNNKGNTGMILLDKPMLDRGRITFKVNTYSTSLPSLILFATPQNQQPEEEAKEDQPKEVKRVTNPHTTRITDACGECLIFRLHNSNPTLSYYGFSADGVTLKHTISNLIRIPYTRNNNITSTSFDLRYDKENQIILLYAGKSMIGKWDIPEIRKMKGQHIGLINLYKTNSRYSIRDILASSWNGVIEPASSMEHDERDSALLTNGTDRYSGAALSLKNDKLHLKTNYADLRIPQSDIQSLFLSRQKQTKLPYQSKDEMAVRFYGSGKLTGIISKGPDQNIILTTKSLGKLKINLEYISAYDFEDLDQAFDQDL